MHMLNHASCVIPEVRRQITFQTCMMNWTISKGMLWRQKTWLTIKNSSEELGAWLKRWIVSEAWIYQHSILPSAFWPILVHATVESLEMKISSVPQKWLALPCSLTSNALYGTSNTLQQPFSGLTEDFKVARTREVSQHCEGKAATKFHLLGLR